MNFYGNFSLNFIFDFKVHDQNHNVLLFVILSCIVLNIMIFQSSITQQNVEIIIVFEGLKAQNV